MTVTTPSSYPLGRTRMAEVDLRHGDCIDVLRTLPAGSVDSVVTSPPYAMQRKSTYGGVPEKDYPEWTVAWMREVWRVLKDDGSVIINISPHIKNGELSDYVLRTRLALREDGWTELDELVWHKTDAMPTGSPSRPRRSWESLLWFGKHGRAFSDAKAGGKPPLFQRPVGSIGGRADRLGWDHSMSGSKSIPKIARVPNVAVMGKAKRATVDHPAMFPWQLAEWCGKLITPPGGTILDPFTGSSSTGVAAIKNGWNFIGIDQSAEYIEISNRRLNAELAKAAEKGSK